MRPAVIGLALTGLLAACIAPDPSPSASPSAEMTPHASSGPETLVLTEPFREAVTAPAIEARLADLLEIAQANGGIRAVGTPGFDASVDYAADVLREAGYTVTLDEFDYPYFEETEPVSLAVTGGQAFVGGDHARALIFSASGTVEALVASVSATAGQGGCVSSDWDDFPAGAIAVAGPGPCFRRDQVIEAQQAGAVGLVVAYPSWATGEVRRPTLLFPDGIDIPAVSASAAVGEALIAAAEAGASVRLEVHTLNEQRTTRNVIADRAGNQPDEVVMAGGHLDSVMDGPGINDNGSGTMTILELATRLAQLPTTERSVRFGLWAAEEIGLYGSRSYIDQLGTQTGANCWPYVCRTADRSEIVAYLNLDMVASPNFVRAVYAGEGGPAGSQAITDLFTSYFDAIGLNWELEDVGGASDHAPFADVGIPVGGLFTGASELKTDRQAALFGGTAGEPNSACYHLACDTTTEINDVILDQLADAAAHALWILLAGG
jgi:Zn-dependent M28 family amino/carboxypeptidase